MGNRRTTLALYGTIGYHGFQQRQSEGGRCGAYMITASDADGKEAGQVYVRVRIYNLSLLLHDIPFVRQYAELPNERGTVRLLGLVFIVF